MMAGSNTDTFSISHNEELSDFSRVVGLDGKFDRMGDSEFSVQPVFYPYGRTRYE